MGNSLQDELLKAGLIDKQKINQVAKQKKAQQKKKVAKKNHGRRPQSIPRFSVSAKRKPRAIAS